MTRPFTISVLCRSLAAVMLGAGCATVTADQGLALTRSASHVLYADRFGYAEHIAGAEQTRLAATASTPDASPTPQQLRVRNAALIAGSGLLVGAYGLRKWWNDGFTGDFRSVSEGWFGQDTPYGGADKLGHAFFAYAGTRLLTRAFEAAGNDPGRALGLGVWTTLGIMTAVEVLDGYSKQYEFSKEDAIMNVAGVALGYVLERNPDLDRLIDMRLLYRPSAGKFDPAGDYSGQKYLLAAKASGVPALRDNPLLRYFELTAGYGARGYESAPGVERSRHLYFGISLNLSEILGQTVFDGASGRSRAQRATDLFFRFIQVPGTAALADHRL
jgi:hypothetical protein